MDLVTATRQLYDAAPADFVALRTTLVKQAKADGDRDLAAQVQELRRPTVAAWYVNLLVRHGDPALMALLDLGVTMRAHQAQFNVAAINELTPQRRALENQALHNLQDLLEARNTTASAASLDEVRGTITAAISDERADAVVRTGTLVRSLSYAGFGVDLEGAAMTMPPPRLRLVRDDESPPAPAPASEPPAPPPPEVPDSDSSAPQDHEPDPEIHGSAEPEPGSEPSVRTPAGTSASPEEPTAPPVRRPTARDRDHQQREALARRRVAAAQRALDQAEQRLGAATAARDEALDTLREAQSRLDEFTDADSSDPDPPDPTST